MFVDSVSSTPKASRTTLKSMDCISLTSNKISSAQLKDSRGMSSRNALKYNIYRATNVFSCASKALLIREHSKACFNVASLNYLALSRAISIPDPEIYKPIARIIANSVCSSPSRSTNMFRISSRVLINRYAF